ncbi:uncharacterized protein LOC118743588 [Rhagoletis pomonella]|uniref:uncharacterized protein LOC118743588 n=1 Tax=Rhagoletis pomonella TaxID=28610 RepID=UPI00177E5002|nr:uncharacterized protein LOC118743588 [Rhagoletis pomonella]
MVNEGEDRWKRSLCEGITADETKYYTIVAEIDSAVLTHATDIISSPPVSGKYDALKQRLITEFGESNEKTLKRLFEGCESGEKKPTTLLRDMKDLASQRVDKDVLKSLWLRRLPVQVEQILSTLEGDIEALAKKVDNIMEISTTNGNIEVVGVPSEDSSPAIADLISRLDRLERSSNNGKFREERSRSNAVSGTTSSTSSRKTTTQPAHDTCWYHRTFCENATRCRQLCFRSETFGKLISHPFKAAPAEADNNCSRLYVRDRTSSLKFLVDTDAEISVVPKSGNDKRSRAP